MAAKSKRTTRATRAETAAQEPDVEEMFGMRLRASQHHEELLEEARSLRRAGKIREAKGVEKRAQQVEQLLGALEADGRQSNPHSVN